MQRSEIRKNKGDATLYSTHSIVLASSDYTIPMRARRQRQKARPGPVFSTHLFSLRQRPEVLMRYLAIAALLLGLSACAHDPNRDAWRNVRILQAEPKEAYTVVGESWAYAPNMGNAWAPSRAVRTNRLPSTLQRTEAISLHRRLRRRPPRTRMTLRADTTNTSRDNHRSHAPPTRNATATATATALRQSPGSSVRS